MSTPLTSNAPSTEPDTTVKDYKEKLDELADRAKNPGSQSQSQNQTGGIVDKGAQLSLPLST